MGTQPHLMSSSSRHPKLAPYKPAHGNIHEWVSDYHYAHPNERCAVNPPSGRYEPMVRLENERDGEQRYHQQRREQERQYKVAKEMHRRQVFQELEARRDAEVGADEANETDRVQELSLQAEQEASEIDAMREAAWNEDRLGQEAELRRVGQNQFWVGTAEDRWRHLHTPLPIPVPVPVPIFGGPPAMVPTGLPPPYIVRPLGY